MISTPFSVPSESVVRDADAPRQAEPADLPDDSIFPMTAVIVGFGVGISALVVLTQHGWAVLVAVCLLIPIGVVAIVLTLNHMMREPEEAGGPADERPGYAMRKSPASTSEPASSSTSARSVAASTS